ncbi:MAG TPA: hypothetical protein VKU41_25135 [Polyangiaceae bacterium]|nr:hypothetical protein [Polyangiaceae bacterium]
MVSRWAPALVAILLGCGKSTLDVGGSARGTDDGGASEPPEADASAGGSTDAIQPDEDRTPASSPGPEASGGDAEDAAADGSPSDAPPELPCADRALVDCDCVSDVCSSQSTRMEQSILQVTDRCRLACNTNYFTFDDQGCVTGYTHNQDPYTEDACVLQALANVRFSCTAGVSQPFHLYWSCTLM